MILPLLVSTRVARLSCATRALEPLSVKATPFIRSGSVHVRKIVPVLASKTYNVEFWVTESLTTAATVDPSRDVATFLELAGRFGSLTGYGNDQSGVPLLLDVKPCCRKSVPAAFDSMHPLRSAALAAATPELPLPNEEKDHTGVPLPVIACMVRRAPLRSHAPHTLFASIDTPSAIAVGSS